MAPGETGAALSTEFEQLEKEWLNALRRHDLDALKSLLHDDFTSTSARSSGEILSKQDYVSAAVDLYVCDYEIRDLQAWPWTTLQ